MSEGKPINIRRWLAQRAEALALRDQTRFISDVFANPSIGPVAAWLISGLVMVVAWLTQHYAPGAVDRAADGVQRDDFGIIPIWMGYWTFGAVGAITLIAAAQPFITTQFRASLARPFASRFSELNIVLRAPLTIVGLSLTAIYHAPAWAFSSADYFLARPAALLAGAGCRQAWQRYGIFLAWMVASLASTWLLPAPFGLYAFAFGSLLIIGVIRRWNWVEADREAFFVTRRHDPEAERIGFAEDLRDEALVALVFLFLLIPLGLRQVDLAWPATFHIKSADHGEPSVLAWVGFFGAELAKSAPFVDWSEVFHVANGSPIEPDTVLGAQVVFAMRAMLDLIMIAAVLQAIQLASRLSEQGKAFAAGKVDILEPFMERAKLRELWAKLARAEAGMVLKHRALRDFPPYNPTRLYQIVDPVASGSSTSVQASADSLARRAALALIAWQKAPQDALGVLGRVRLGSDEELSKFSEQLRDEIDRPLAILTRAHKLALDAKVQGASIGAKALLAQFKDDERALALRAIASAWGKLDVMVAIPAGSFVMGAPQGEEGASDAERPQHQVRVAPFEIGKYPVTFDEFDAFCDATGYYRRETGSDRPFDGGWGRSNRPVIFVSWDDAKAYIAWLNTWSEGGYRLPSEAEWEYACRAGTTTRWSSGDDEATLSEFGWFEKNSDKPHPVGEKRPNDFGLHDMHGNVLEWVEDRWHDTYAGAPSDGAGWSGGDSSRRIVRGGTWNNNSLFLRSAYRLKINPSFRDYNYGFRVARTPLDRKS